MESQDARALNARIAANYDALVYDPLFDPAIDAQWILGLGALYGAAPGFGDVLDLGCGTGAHLDQLGSAMTGRLLGFDLSTEAISRASMRLAKYGVRAKVTRADILDLEAESLGRFDLIFSVGMIYVTPPQVQRHIVELIGRCLKPGGIALLGYQAGSVAMLRAGLHRSLRANDDPAKSPAERIAAARLAMDGFAASTRATGAHKDFLLAALNQSAAVPDEVFFHEALNHVFDPLPTSEIDAWLAPHGAGFATYLSTGPFSSLPTAKERSAGADAYDFAFGGYRHALFVRWKDGRQSPDIRTQSVEWRSDLVRAGEGSAAAPSAFLHKPTGIKVTVPRAPMQALLDVLADGPLSLAAALPALRQRLAKAGKPLSQENETVLLGDLEALWGHGAIIPLRRGAP